MDSLLKKTLIVFTCLLTISGMAGSSLATGVYQNFDNLPATGENEIPGNGGGWHYSSFKTNTRLDFNGSCGWWNENYYASPNDNIYDFFYLYKNGYNNAHMGYTSFSFLEIDSSFAIHGNSLKITTTGGIKDDGNTTVGLPLQTKEEYLEYINNSQNPVGSVSSGSPYIYFNNNSPNDTKIAYPIAAGANRLSFYIYLPETVDNNGSNGNDIIISPPMELGPGNGIGGHWYNRFYTRGGGWTHVQMDSHPNHNNAWQNADDWPYPSLSCRDYGVDFFNNLHSLYLAINPYGNVAIPKYYIWIDEMQYIYDDEPQNGETINDLSVLYKHLSKSFEIGFHSKYKSAGLDKATYEIKYSFNQITNNNWSEATPVHILEDSRFNITANTTGIVKKPNSWRDPVWASFKLTTEDEPRLSPGTKIYFAVKDVSQDPNNLQVPNPAYNNGRDYQGHMADLDYAGDAPALPLIKRIDYYISGVGASAPKIQSIKIN